jgi:hypothetical protein
LTESEKRTAPSFASGLRWLCNFVDSGRLFRQSFAVFVIRTGNAIALEFVKISVKLLDRKAMAMFSQQFKLFESGIRDWDCVRVGFGIILEEEEVTILGISV